MYIPWWKIKATYRRIRRYVLKLERPVDRLGKKKLKQVRDIARTFLSLPQLVIVFAEVSGGRQKGWCKAYFGCCISLGSKYPRAFIYVNYRTGDVYYKRPDGGGECFDRLEVVISETENRRATALAEAVKREELIRAGIIEVESIRKMKCERLLTRENFRTPWVNELRNEERINRRTPADV